MTSNTVLPLPDAFKSIKPYITLADQLEQKNERAISYYCRVYGIQTAMGINKTAPECKKYLIHNMDLLEKIKSSLKNDESIGSQTVGQAFVERYALNIFHTADNDDRASKFSKNLVKQFYTAGLLFDTLNYFGELSEDLIVKKDYAKKKAMYLNRCFQNNETPIPGPLLQSKDDEFGANEENNEQDDKPDVPQYKYMPSVPTQPQQQYNMPTLPPQPSPRREPETKPIVSVPTSGEAVIHAQKYCKYAQSALQYEDIPTAIDNLGKCLALLKTGK